MFGRHGILLMNDELQKIAEKYNLYSDQVAALAEAFELGRDQERWCQEQRENYRHEQDTPYQRDCQC
ncbi:MAG: hypothetical protein DWQ19_08915 [Crenarchaeota archaeon]|nr:MAG: hypothetical protein DWQ19_08915 [Thermoproteota archaeon]